MCSVPISLDAKNVESNQSQKAKAKVESDPLASLVSSCEQDVIKKLHALGAKNLERIV